MTDPVENTPETLEPAGDVSPRVHELMQRLDRLPPGVYELTITKPDVRAMDWNGVIRREGYGVIDSFELRKRRGNYNPE